MEQAHLAALAASFGHAHLAIGITGASTAAVVTVAVFDFAPAGLDRVLWTIVSVASGLSVMVAFGVFWIMRFSALVKADLVNNNQCQRIRNRIAEIDSTLASSPTHRAGSKEEEAKTQTRRLLDELVKDLDRVSSFWIDGTAYLEAWARLNRAEEEAVMCGQLVHVRSVVVRDIDRVRGSEIPDAPELQGRLKDALKEIEVAIRHGDGNGNGSALVTMARGDVRYGLNTVNEYREGQWRALVDFRDVATTTAALLWITMFATLLVALAAGASAQEVTGALMFFMAGSIAGFLSQMYSQSRSGSESSVEDFGLALARIFAMPAFSGAIGLVGVVAVAALHINLNGVSFSPATDGGAAVNWTSVFNWQTNGIGFGIAFILALAPERLFDLLKSSQDIKVAISRTEAAG